MPEICSTLLIHPYVFNPCSIHLISSSWLALSTIFQFLIFLIRLKEKKSLQYQRILLDEESGYRQPHNAAISNISLLPPSNSNNYQQRQIKRDPRTLTNGIQFQAFGILLIFFSFILEALINVATPNQSGYLIAMMIAAIFWFLLLIMITYDLRYETKFSNLSILRVRLSIGILLW